MFHKKNKKPKRIRLDEVLLLLKDKANAFEAAENPKYSADTIAGIRMAAGMIERTIFST